MLRAFQGIGLLLLIGFSCRADLTLRYTFDLKIGGAMPPAIADAASRRIADMLSKENVIRIKGDRTLSGIGAINGIIDDRAADVTLLNPATKQYARMPIVDYLAAIAPATPMTPAALQALDRMKIDVRSVATGQMAMVFGIRAEEHLTTEIISMDLPGTAAAAQPLARLEIHTWLASPADLDRIPGLRQYADYAQRALSVFNSTGEIQRLFGQMPGVGEKMQAMTGELTKNAGSLTVKMQESFYMPIMATMSAKPDPAKPGPNAPFSEIDMNLVSISTDAIDDSVFDVPPDYQVAPVSELIAALRPAPAVPTVPTAPVATRTDLAPGEQISRVGGGVSAPSVIFKPEPEYTREARNAKLSGVVVLSVVVDKEGVARNIQIVRPLGMGLDEKAIEAVSQWKFRPAQKDGQPVNVRATIEVNFNLLLNPPLQ